MSIPSIIVMTPLLLSSFRCFPYGPSVSPRRDLLSPRQLEREREREREDPTTLSRQIPARIIGYERFRSVAHKFHVDRISGGFSMLGGGGGGRDRKERERERETTMSEQISSTSGNLSNLGQVGRFARPRIERIDQKSTALI